MKYWYGFILNCLMAVSLTAQVNHSVIVKSIEMDFIDEIYIDDDFQVSYETWDKPYGRVMISVTTEGINKAEFKTLLRNNRYKMEAENIDGLLQVSLPNLTKDLLDNLDESVEIKCFIPRSVEVPAEATIVSANVELIF